MTLFDAVKGRMLLCVGFCTVTGLVIALIFARLATTRVQRDCVAEIESAGGHVRTIVGSEDDLGRWLRLHLAPNCVVEIDTSHTDYDDITRLGTFTNLRVVNLANTPIRDATPLAELDHVTWLDISGTAITDISSIGNLTNLGSLNISRTQVKDISALTDLRFLHTLDLSQTSVREIFPLKRLEWLTKLDASDTEISEADLDDLQMHLPACQIIR